MTRIVKYGVLGSVGTFFLLTGIAGCSGYMQEGAEGPPE